MKFRETKHFKTSKTKDKYLSLCWIKVTQPRASARTSSGHGSDSSAAGPTAKPVGGRLSFLFPSNKNKPRNRESYSASSGYESAGGHKDLDSDQGPSSDSVLLPKTAKTKKGYFSGLIFHLEPRHIYFVGG